MNSFRHPFPGSPDFHTDKRSERERLLHQDPAFSVISTLDARNAARLSRLRARLISIVIERDDWGAWYRSKPAVTQRLDDWPIAHLWTLFAAYPLDRSLASGAGREAHQPLNQTQALAAIAHAADIADRFLDLWEPLASVSFKPVDPLAENLHYATLRAGWCSIAFWWADLNEVRACLVGDIASADEWHSQAVGHRIARAEWLQRMTSIFQRLEHGEASTDYLDDRAFELLTGRTRPKRPEEDEGWPWSGPRI